MSLKAMADTVRAEQRRATAAAPAARHKARVEAGRRWKENKRRARSRSRTIFEAAFRRQFSPHRFTYETVDSSYGDQIVRVSINYEGKLLAYCNVYLGERRAPWLHVRPLNDPDAQDKMLQVSNDGLHDALSKLVEKWGLG